MSPLVAQPNRGYSDYQRTSNYDSGVLFSGNSGSSVFPIGSGILDVSRYAYVGAWVSCTAGTVLVSISWFLDAAGSIPLGSQQFVADSHITNPLTSRLVNLGPFCDVSISQVVGGSSVSMVMIGSNRDYPIAITPVNPVLMDQQAAAIGANATVTVYPFDYYAGPVQFGFFSTPGVVTFRLKYLTSSNSWDFVQEAPVSAAGAWDTFTWITPPGAWRMEMANGGTAGDFYLTATPSATGSA